MKETDESDARPSSEGDDGDTAALRSLLQGALRGEREAVPVDVLSGVQKKLRQRSGGKFYADTWSTAKQPPTLTFLVTGALMLVVVLVAFAILVPLRGKPEAVKTEPAPIEIVAPPPR